jgi:hypothetical protein
MSLTELARGIDIGKKGMGNHLYRLAMQSKLSTFGRLLQFVASGPLGMVHSRLSVDLNAEVPDFGGFHLCISKYSKQIFVRMQSENVDCFHVNKLLSLFVSTIITKHI